MRPKVVAPVAVRKSRAMRRPAREAGQNTYAVQRARLAVSACRLMGWRNGSFVSSGTTTVVEYVAGGFLEERAPCRLDRGGAVAGHECARRDRTRPRPAQPRRSSRRPERLRTSRR